MGPSEDAILWQIAEDLGGNSLQFFLYILRTKVTTDIFAKWAFKKFTKLQEEQSLRN